MEAHAESWANSYVGIPYSSQGRDRDGCDCWGLIRLVYFERFGLELPSFVDAYESAQDMAVCESVISEGKVGFKEVREPKEADIVLCRILGFETHVGIYIDGGQMLHVMRGVNACVVSLDSAMWKRRVVGYFRQPVGIPTAA